MPQDDHPTSPPAHWQLYLRKTLILLSFIIFACLSSSNFVARPVSNFFSIAPLVAKVTKKPKRPRASFSHKARPPLDYLAVGFAKVSNFQLFVNFEIVQKMLKHFAKKYSVASTLKCFFFQKFTRFKWFLFCVTRKRFVHWSSNFNSLSSSKLSFANVIEVIFLSIN